ncbi:MAG: PstC family ABC transporter permease [Terracidiphilus sp.]
MSEIRISQVKPQPEPGAPERKRPAATAALETSAVRKYLLSRGNSAFADHGFKWLMILCALSIFGIVVLIVAELVMRSSLVWGQLHFDFFYKAYMDPGTGLPSYWDPVNGHFSAIPFVYGTVIIYGLWAMWVLVPIMRDYVNPLLVRSLGWTGFFADDNPTGLGFVTAAIILAVMILPIISSLTREVMSAVPHSQREAVLALGATRWEMIRVGVLRNARIGIVGAIILGLGRALGETMAVTMVIGNAPEIHRSLLSNGYSMASVIANEFTEAVSDLHRSALMEIGLALFIVTIVVNALAQFLVWAVTRGAPARVN